MEICLHFRIEDHNDSIVVKFKNKRWPSSQMFRIGRTNNDFGAYTPLFFYYFLLLDCFSQKSAVIFLIPMKMKLTSCK